MKFSDIITNARIELLEPLVQRPSRRYLLQLASTNLQSFFNKVTQTGRPWAVCNDPYMLVVQPNISDYHLGVGDEFGRPLDVTTYDPGNASFIERQVPFYELADQKYNWDGPRNDQMYLDSAGHAARRMSFYRKGFTNDVWVSVWPVPQVASQYRILYSMGNWASEMELEESPLLSQHHDLLVVKTALDALPGTAWSDDEKENRLRRAELKDSFTLRLPTLMDDFQKFIRNMTLPRMTSILTYQID